jgi:hypothetical protein
MSIINNATQNMHSPAAIVHSMNDVVKLERFSDDELSKMNSSYVTRSNSITATTLPTPGVDEKKIIYIIIQ